MLLGLVDISRNDRHGTVVDNDGYISQAIEFRFPRQDTRSHVHDGPIGGERADGLGTERRQVDLRYPVVRDKLRIALAIVDFISENLAGLLRPFKEGHARLGGLLARGNLLK